MRKPVSLIGAVCSVIILIASTTSLGLCASVDGKKEILLKAADIQPEDYPTVMSLKHMAKVLDEKTQGRIKMEIYAGAQLGGEKETIEMTQMGTVAVSRVNTSPLVSFVPMMGAFSMPYLFRDADHFWKVLDGPIGQAMAKELEKSNLVGLAYYDSGARSFYTKNTPINTASDAKGQKIRVQQSKIFVDLINTLGASATPMGYGEVYSGLQTGIIDGAENNPPSLWSSKHYEVCKYFSLDEHARVPEMVIISKKVWDTLTADDQKIVRQAALESEEYEKRAWNDYTEKSLKELKDKGVNIRNADKESFRKAVQPMYDKYPEYKDIIAQIQAMK